ncbi:MAG: mannitol dehydrogenase [Clostridia bacterium]|nr:mannitol dehydrogenase [Clostridia bacterium]
MKAVMYGGGNIGRGFIGMLFSASGYEVTFVDVAEAVVDTLNREHTYPVRIIRGEEHQDIDVRNVCAVNGNNAEAVAEAIAEADIMATAVGVNVLKFIIPNLVAGIRLRKERGCKPFNILICENLMDANKVIEGMLKEHLNEEEQAWFDENIGLVEASIGRMVPIQTEEMKDGNPMRVCVESYGYLPVDKDAFKGEIPAIKNMVPFSPFDFYLKRKLYVHNMGHGMCAYLGNLLGLEYIYQAIDRDEIYLLVRGAMEESARALSIKYNVPLEEILKHITDLLNRFTNAALKDTCQRVGGDPTRKLSPQDRMIGSSTLALETGIMPAYIAIGAAAGVHRYINEAAGMVQSVDNAAYVLQTVSGLQKDSALAVLILSMYQKILEKADLRELRRFADAIIAEYLKEVI